MSLVNFVKANPKPFFIILWLSLIAVIVFSLRACDSSNFEERQRERERELDRIKEQSRNHEERANIAEEKAKLLSEENRELRDQAASLREAIANFKNERVIIRERYAAKGKEFDSITDAAALRKKNCSERKALGFPCP